MGAVYFYHLTRQPLEVTLRLLVQKSLDQKWRVGIRANALERLTYLDAQLWVGPEDSFLPHGLSDQPHAADQPVLLSMEPSFANGATCIMSVGGADLTPDEINAAERCCILFDGNDPEDVDIARGQWKALTSAGCAAQYWSEESGRWEKKAEKPAL